MAWLFDGVQQIDHLSISFLEGGSAKLFICSPTLCVIDCIGNVGKIYLGFCSYNNIFYCQEGDIVSNLLIVQLFGVAMLQI